MSSGNAIIIAATILGLSVIGSAFVLVRSIDSASSQVSALGSAVAQLDGRGGPPAAPPRAEQARRRGPDPERVYDVSVGDSPVRGPADAEVTLVEFSDFQCPFCGRVKPTLEQIQATYGEEVRIVFKHLPLSIHPQAPLAHAAAEAAKNQGKFWEMHDLIFGNQRQLTEEKYIEYAGQIGLDVEQFKVDLGAPETRQRVQADVAEAAALGVTGTPGFFVNGRFLSGAKPFSEFKRAIDAELAEG